MSELLFALICRSTPIEARELCAPLPEAERARLALFCNARTHFREIGRAIAGSCGRDSLIREGGYAGVVLHEQAEAGWGGRETGPKTHSKQISLSRPGLSGASAQNFDP